jgi:hypothetical protein
MRHSQLWITVFLLSLALTIIAVPAWAQQGGMGGMGDRSSGPARAVNPSGTGTMAPGARPGMGSMGSNSGVSSLPATRPLGCRLGVRPGCRRRGPGDHRMECRCRHRVRRAWAEVRNGRGSAGCRL